MFYLKKLNKEKPGPFVDDEFGWWIGEDSIVPKCESNSCSWSSSSASMKSCIDFVDKSDTFSLDHQPCDKVAQRFEQTNVDSIEMCSFMPHVDYENIDLQLIEKDADDSANSIEDNANYQSRDTGHVRAHCYTPERIIRCQDYRILTPLPRFTSLFENIATANIAWSRNDLKNISSLFYCTEASSHLKTVLCPNIRDSQVSITLSRRRRRKFRKRIQNTLSYSENSIERQSSGQICVNNYNKNSEHRLSTNYSTYQCDSNISSETVGTDVAFNDESSLTSGSRLTNENLNEIITLTESDSEKSVGFLDEDRFCEKKSKHNLLTRLALTIETDDSIPHVIDDTDNVIHQLRIKVEKLQQTNKNILKEIYALKDDFRSDVDKVKHLSATTKQFRADIDEIKYLDDLLNLLQGKLERISRRKWPFALRHLTFKTGEKNLVI